MLELFLILQRALNRSEYKDQVTVNLDKGTPRHRDRDKGTLSCRFFYKKEEEDMSDILSLIQIRLKENKSSLAPSTN